MRVEGYLGGKERFELIQGLNVSDKVSWVSFFCETFGNCVQALYVSEFPIECMVCSGEARQLSSTILSSTAFSKIVSASNFILLVGETFIQTPYGLGSSMARPSSKLEVG